MRVRSLLTKHVSAHPHSYELSSVIIISLGANVLTSALAGEDVYFLFVIGGSLIISGGVLFILTSDLKSYYEGGQRIMKLINEKSEPDSSSRPVDNSPSGLARKFAMLQSTGRLIRSNLLILLVVLLTLWAGYCAIGLTTSRSVRLKQAEENEELRSTELRIIRSQVDSILNSARTVSTSGDSLSSHAE